MFYRNSNDSKHLNIRIVSLAAGLALATATVIGASDLLKEEHSSNSTTSSVTPRVERIAPQFGSAADAVYASQGIRAPSQFTTEADAVYAMEGMVADVATVPNAAIDGRDQALGIGQPSVGQSFATQVDAVYAMEGMIANVDTVPNAAIDGRDQALGIGQPGERQSAVAGYPAESQLDYSLPTTFDADLLPGIGQPSAGQASGPENLNNYLGVGHPDETSSVHPQFGTMADADFASR